MKEKKRGKCVKRGMEDSKKQLRKTWRGGGGGGCGGGGCFFFFKQKTAYEIVSRDWSSDVCSSDLKFHIRTIVRQKYQLFAKRSDQLCGIDQT